MPTQLISWKCNTCMHNYSTNEEATICENKHIPPSAIKVIKVTHDNGPKGFPWELDVTADHSDSVKPLTATYKVHVVTDNKGNVIWIGGEERY